MNTLQASTLVKKICPINMHIYMAPEVFEEPDLFAFCLYDKLHNAGPSYTAIAILHNNYEPLKNRILGTITDSYLSKKTFNNEKGNMALHCYNLLEQLNNLEEWQIQLKDIFKEMSY